MKKPESHSTGRVFVRPNLNAATGEAYSTHHPSNRNERIPSAGAFVPNDMFTKRRIREGSWALSQPTAPEPQAVAAEPTEDIGRKRSRASAE